MRKKVIRFQENHGDPYIVETGKPFYDNAKGNWNKEYFKNDNPITLEVACGKGEYTSGLSIIYPHKNFVGIDIKGERLRYGAKHAKDNNVKNAGFLRTIVHDLEKFFDKNEVDDIRVVHPDPRPKNRDTRKRLTHPRFLDMYKKILKPGGTLRLKTDDTNLFYYSVETLVQEGRQVDAITFDLYESTLYEEHHDIKTHYEKIFTEQGRRIKYIRCTNIK